MLETSTRRFTDRRAAGRELGDRLSSLALEDPVVLGLARGGVPVAYEVGHRLDAELDVLVVRKIGARRHARDEHATVHRPARRRARAGRSLELAGA